MSSFFRTVSDVTESEETSDSQTSSDSSDSPNQLIPRSQAVVGASQHHQNVLVHALLEEKCLNDVCQELNASCPTASTRRYTKDDPEVRAQAGERYRLLSAKLVSHGIINGGPEDDNFHNLRQNARDGLTMLSQQLNVMELSNEDSNIAQDHLRLGPPTRRLLEAPADVNAAWKSSTSFVPTPVPQPRNLHLAQLLPSHPLLDSTRYTRDFEEICMLGKGGYGSVYHVSHRLDGRSYAVKKIKLGPEVLSRVQQNGESELNAILRELRTMARLEHPNIVRYFGGWVEWSRETDPIGSSSSSQPRLITQGTGTTSASSKSDGILFADTVSGSPSPAAADDAVEEISRPAPSPPPSPGPSLTLHIQMSLYPLTLANYLFTTQTPRHCFHRAASLRLFASVLAGVAHLHAHAIAHRDIKPANVFLAPLGVPTGCPGCGPWAVCVGDLGLVAEASARGGVGTAMYRPPIRGGAQEQDLYALGVVLVELLVPFGTRMERGDVLGAAREGILPKGLGKEERGIVRALMEADAVTAEGIRLEVERLLQGIA